MNVEPPPRQNIPTLPVGNTTDVAYIRSEKPSKSLQFWTHTHLPIIITTTHYSPKKKLTPSHRFMPPLASNTKELPVKSKKNPTLQIETQPQDQTPAETAPPSLSKNCKR